MAENRLRIGFFSDTMREMVLPQQINVPPIGRLELLILQQLWDEGATDVKAMHQRLPADQRPSVNTVQSAMERLYRKRLASRTKLGHAYVYEVAVAREELLQRYFSELARQLAAGHEDMLLAAFVDFATNLDESALRRLEGLIEDRRDR